MLTMDCLQCDNMAREGLRTLVVAKKTLTEEQYADFEVCHLLCVGVITRKEYSQYDLDVCAVHE